MIVLPLYIKQDFSVIFITLVRFEQFSTNGASSGPVECDVVSSKPVFPTQKWRAGISESETVGVGSCCPISRLTSWLYYIALKERKSRWWTFIEVFPQTLHKHPWLSKSAFSTVKQICPNSLLYYSVFINMQFSQVVCYVCYITNPLKYSKPSCDCIHNELEHLF